MHPDSVSRIVQGLATGIGFLGAGAKDAEVHSRSDPDPKDIA
jgi:hypothetical protein